MINPRYDLKKNLKASIWKRKGEAIWRNILRFFPKKQLIMRERKLKS